MIYSHNKCKKHYPPRLLGKNPNEFPVHRKSITIFTNLAFDKLLHDLHVGFTKGSSILGTDISAYG